MALSSATRRRNHPLSRLVTSGWSLNHCQAHSTCASEPSDSPSAKLTARYPAMRSGSSLRLSRLLKSSSSVVGCFIGTKPLQVVNCGCFATLDLAESCSCLLVFAALSHGARENQGSPVRHLNELTHKAGLPLERLNHSHNPKQMQHGLLGT